MDYDEEICNVVSNLLKDGKYDIVISSTYSMCSQLNIDIPLIAFSDLTYNLCTKYLKKTAPKELKERAAAARKSKKLRLLFCSSFALHYFRFARVRLHLSRKKQKTLSFAFFCIRFALTLHPKQRNLYDYDQ